MSVISSAALPVPAASSLDSFHYKFKRTDAGGRWAGKSVRIFKRAGRRFWYVAPERRGRVFRRCLETEQRDAAILKAIEVCDLVWSDDVAGFEARKLRGAVRPVAPGKVATIGEVLAQYRELGPLYQKGRTVPDNINALRLVVREGLGRRGMSAEEVDRQSAEVLTASLVRRFEEGRLALVGSTDRDARRSTLVSVNSYMRGARSVVQKEFRKRYVEDRGLVLPDLEGFMEQRLEEPARAERPEVPAELMTRTCAAAGELKKVNPAAYVAFLLGLCSLRRGEVQRAEASWLVDRGGEWLCVVPTASKSDCRRRVPMPPQVVNEVLEYWNGSIGQRPEWDRKFILPCGRADGRGGVSQGARSRAQGAIKAVNKWMRALGWTTRHTLHELRAFYLHEQREQHGQEVAQATAGHADLETLTRHYTGPKAVVGKWARLPVLGSGDETGAEREQGGKGDGEREGAPIARQ